MSTQQIYDAEVTARGTGKRAKRFHVSSRISPAEYRELTRLSMQTKQPGNLSAGMRYAIKRAAQLGDR